MIRRTIAMLALAAGLLLPARPAAADSDLTTPLIISGAVAGAVLVVYLVAIAGGSQEDDPAFFLSPSLPGGEPPVVPGCRTADGQPALFCW